LDSARYRPWCCGGADCRTRRRDLAPQASAPAGRDTQPPERLVALGLAYIRFARENPQHFLLVFARLPSQRSSLAVSPSAESPYRVVLQAVQDGIESGDFVARSRFGVEEMAYGLWATAHGMAMLQLTHLCQFNADFLDHDRRVLDIYVRGLEQA
jgi:hypothetical protein